MANNPQPSLDDYSTQQAQADEKQRRKVARETLAQWQALRAALDAESIAAIRNITDEEWKAAQEQDDAA